jgi:hypothetical protein
MKVVVSAREASAISEECSTFLEGDQACFWTQDPLDFIASSLLNNVILFKNQLSCHDGFP